MKIKLTANSTAVNETLAQMNLQCGYAYIYGNIENGSFTAENSWPLKVLYKLESMFSSLGKISPQEQDVVKSISKSATFLHEHYEGQEHIEQMHVTMNVNSKLNRALKKSLKFVSSLHQHLAANLSQSLNDFIGQIQPASKRMVIGTSMFLHRSETFGFANAVQNLIPQIGMEKAVDFVVFHEAAHAFEQVNRRLYGTGWDYRIDFIAPLTRRLSQDIPEGELRSVNKSLRDYNRNGGNEHKLEVINHLLMQQIRDLPVEIYADVGAVLMSRNKDIIESRYDHDKSDQFIDMVIKLRQEEQIFKLKLVDATNYVCTFDHYTVPGLEQLKELFPALPQRILSQEEIHQYAQEAVRVGMARVLVASAMATSMLPSNLMTVQLTTLFHLSETEDKIILHDFHPESYQARMSQIKLIAGPGWTARFHDNLQYINEHVGAGLNPEDKARLTWHAAVHPDFFKEEMLKLKAQMKDIREALDFLQESPGEPISSPPAQGSYAKDKNTVLGVVAKLRQNLLGNRNPRLKND